MLTVAQVKEHLVAAKAMAMLHGMYVHENAVAHFTNNDDSDYYMLLELPVRKDDNGEPNVGRFDEQNEFVLLWVTGSSMHDNCTLVSKVSGDYAQAQFGEMLG